MPADQDKDPLDVDAAVERLNAALRLQYRSVLGYTLAAGSVTGFQHLGMAELLWRFAQAELDDTRRGTRPTRRRSSTGSST
jgi:hypothetical protein